MWPRCAEGQPHCGGVISSGLIVTIVLTLGACASSPPLETPVADASVPVESAAAIQQFDRAVTLLGAGDLDLALREFKALSEEYPEYSGPLVNMGIAHMKTGRLAEAQAAFEEAIERNPDNATAHHQLGIAYRRLGRFEAADAAYRRAIEIAPDYALAYLNLGILCDLYLQQPQRALVQYERYVALVAEPDPKVNGWIAEVRSRLGASARTARSE